MTYNWARLTPIKPRLFGCDGGMRFGAARPPFLGMHKWEHSHSWNGNDSRALGEFRVTDHGIARSGWRCFHCGRFVWDESNETFALGYAYHTGQLQSPRASKTVLPKAIPR